MRQTSIPLLSVKNLSVSAEGPEEPTQLLKEISFDIYPGQSLGLVGESGSGKSLTALSLLQLLPPNLHLHPKTQITLEGQPTFPIPFSKLRQIRRHALGVVFQDPNAALNPVLKIETQLKEAFSNKPTFQQCCDCLESVELSNPKRILNAYPFELSGGMQQRVLIAMALAKQARLILLDEATTGLDLVTQKSILQLLKYWQTQGITYLVISHDEAVVKTLTQTQIGIAGGKLIDLKPSSQISLPKPDVPEKTIALSVQNLSLQLPIKKGFFRRTIGYQAILQNLTFTLHNRETLAIVGESGAGKTSLAKLLVGLIKPTQGHIQNYHPDKIQLIFQNAFTSLNPRFCVQEILLEGLFSNPRKSISSENSRPGKNLKLDAQQNCLSLLEQVHLPKNLLKHYPHELSGGQRKRLSIARVLATQANILIFDEPTSNLDPHHEQQILKLLLTLQTQLNLSYLLITHDLRVAKTLSHRILILKTGMIVESGDTQKVLSKPNHSYTKRLIDSIV